MPSLINFGNELIRINFSNNRIEYSTNRGASWITRYSGSYNGAFRDLLPYGDEILACTDKGLYYSRNKGASWICRSSSTYAKTLMRIQDGVGHLPADTIISILPIKNPLQSLVGRSIQSQKVRPICPVCQLVAYMSRPGANIPVIDHPNKASKQIS